MVSLLSSRRALEVARRAATDLLLADDEEIKSKANSRLDNATDLKVLAADALKATKLYLTSAVIAPNSPTKPFLREFNIALKLGRHDRNMLLDNKKHHLSPKLFSI